MKTLFTTISSISKSQKFKILYAGIICLFLSLNYSPAHAQWTRKADELRKRAECINVLYQNKLYVFGGFYDNPVIEKTNEVYDIAANKWSRIASFPAGKEITHQGIVLVDDNIWLIGGRAVDAHGPASSQVIIYNITRNTWSDGPRLINPANGSSFPIGAGGYALLGRTIHVFGGFGPTLCEDQSNLHLTIDVDKYLASPGTVTWENISAPLPVPRNHLSYVVLAGKIYALGGQFKHDCGAADQKDCHVYDPVTNAWTRLTDLPIQRSHAEASTFAVDGKIFMVAGQGVNNATQNTVYQFTPESNNGLGAWTTLAGYKLPGSFLGLSSKLAGNKFIIANGALDKYNNERKETYEAIVTRSSARTLGFAAKCVSQSAAANQKIVASNLLYCIEDESPYTLTSNASWLAVTKNSTGRATQTGVDIEFTINTAGLNAGTYSGKITATATASFCVNLTVTSSSAYNLTISSAGNGSVSKDPEQQSYNANSIVNLTATPASGWKFNGWTGDAASALNPLPVVMTNDKTITATFIQNEQATPLVTDIVSTTSKLYRLGVLIPNTTFYSDRTYVISTVPSSLLNSTLIKTPNDDKKNTSLSVFSFNLSREATVYVGFDPRTTTLPSWLQSWQKLNDKVGIIDPDISYFALYSKDFPAGKVTMGGNMAFPAAGVQGNYIVIAKDKTTSNAAARLTDAEAGPESTKLSLINPDQANQDKTVFPIVKRLVLYPNPAHEIFSIIVPDDYKGISDVHIMDMNGNRFKIPSSQIKTSGNAAEVKLAPLLLKPGLYSVSITSVDGKTETIRIITGSKLD